MSWRAKTKMNCEDTRMLVARSPGPGGGQLLETRTFGAIPKEPLEPKEREELFRANNAEEVCSGSSGLSKVSFQELKTFEN